MTPEQESEIDGNAMKKKIARLMEICGLIITIGSFIFLEICCTVSGYVDGGIPSAIFVNVFWIVCAIVRFYDWCKGN